MTSTTIPVDVLKAALAVIPKSEIRYYLNGLHINAQGRWLEATDGLIALRIPLPFEPPADMNNVIVPREAVERMVNAAKTDGSRIVTLRQEGSNLYRANMGAQDVLFGGMNAQFPDMDRVFTQNYYPIPVGRLPYCLDAKLLAKWFQAQRVLYKSAFLHKDEHPPMTNGVAYIFKRDGLQCAIAGHSEKGLDDAIQNRR